MGGILGQGLALVRGLVGKPASRSGSADPGVPAAYKNLNYASQNVFRYGLDNGSSVPFFSSIQIFQMSRRTYQSFTLINPKIVSWQHDKLDYSQGAETAQNEMSIIYEAVIYGVGAVKNGNPTGFGTDFYDKQPSPLSILGGGTRSLFGPGGVVGGIGAVLGDLSNPETFKSPFALFGTLVKGANTVNNARKLSKEGLRQEGFGLITGALGAATGTNLSGVSNTLFPKNKGNGQNQTTTALAPRESAGRGSLTARDQALITGTAGALTSLTNLAVNSGVVVAGPSAESQVQELLNAGRNIKLNNLANKIVQDLKG